MTLKCPFGTGFAAGTVAVFLAAGLANGAPTSDPAAARGYEEIVKPFFAEHCLSCHGAKKAKAGYRIDLLGVDFSKVNVAEGWKEVIDRINAGEMPPEEQPRPDARQAAAVVAWVNAQLHAVELAA